MKIKKIISVIILCSMALTLLYACSPDDGNNNNNNIENNGGGGSGNPVENLSAVANTNFTSQEIADAVIAVFTAEEIPNTGLRNFFSGADENSDNYLEPERTGLLIYSRLQLVEEFDYLEDFSLYVPAGQSIFEVSVLKVKEDQKNNINAVKTILETRMGRVSLGELQDYAPLEEPIFHNMKVIIVENYVIFLATTDNRRAENIIAGMIYGDASVSLANAGENTETSEEAPDQIIQNPLPVNMDNVVDVESEILFDFDELLNIDFSGQTQVEAGARRTNLPRVDVRHHFHNTHFIIGGKCEPGAMIRVTGGLHEIYTGSNHGNFLVDVPFAAEGTTILRLTAEAPGKEPSEEIAFVVSPRRDVSYFEDFGIFGVVVGYNHMTFFADNLDGYTGEDLISDTEIAGITTRISNRITQLRDRGCNAEIIYLLVPNTSRLWAEDMPVRYTMNTGTTLLDQWSGAVRAGGGTVLDLTDLMRNHKNDEYKIWHYTDSHWTEYGAYLGYNALMNYIARSFPDAAPRPRSDFEFYNTEIDIGDIAVRIGVDHSALKEYTTFANFNFDPPHFNSDFNKGHLGRDLYNRNNSYIIHARVAHQHTTNSNMPGNLPSVYVMRDSFEGPLHAFYTDRFSTATFAGMWDYNFNAAEIARLNPDYVLYVISERNIRNVMFN